MLEFPGCFGSIVFFRRVRAEDVEVRRSTLDSDDFVDAVRNSSKIDTSYFHVGIYGGAGYLIHATASRGVVQQTLDSAIKDLQPDVVEYAEVSVSDTDKVQAVRFCQAAVGAEYNDVFSADNVNSRGNHSYYCCQLVSQAYGRHLFNKHCMNFMDDQHNFISYWVTYFNDRKCKIPQDEPGTHPSILRYSPSVRFRASQQITMKSFSIPKNLTEALHFIGGKRINLSRENPVFEVFEPRSGNVLTKVEEAKRSDVQFAVESSRNAQEKWAQFSREDKRGVLWKVGELLRQNVDEIARWETLDNGKSIYESRADVLSCADTFEHFSSVDLNGEHIPLADQEQRFAYTRREPLGVVGAVGAWNYPIQTASWKIAPAIACGNGIVYKPSPLAPITATILAQLIQTAGAPDGLVNIVQGGAQTGAAICQARDIKKVSFTGSVSTGRIIAQMAASDFVKPVTLELGGKSSCIMFDDCDVEVAVAGAMMANFYTQGSVCSNASKILVHKKILPQFTELLAEKTRNLKIGDPLDENTKVGACISKEHLEKVKSYIDGAVAEGAKIVCGGNKASVKDLPGGYFLEPCILSDITPSMTVYKEEIFGAALLILPFETEEEALRIANDTQFGLAAGVFTNNLRRAHEFANRLEAGTVYVNTFNDVSPLVPFGGYSQSGYGRENGKAAVEYYSQIKSVFVNASGKLENPF